MGSCLDKCRRAKEGYPKNKNLKRNLSDSKKLLYHVREERCVFLEEDGEEKCSFDEEDGEENRAYDEEDGEENRAYDKDHTEQLSVERTTFGKTQNVGESLKESSYIPVEDSQSRTKEWIRSVSDDHSSSGSSISLIPDRRRSTGGQENYAYEADCSRGSSSSSATTLVYSETKDQSPAASGITTSLTTALVNIESVDKGKNEAYNADESSDTSFIVTSPPFLIDERENHANDVDQSSESGIVTAPSSAYSSRMSLLSSGDFKERKDHTPFEVLQLCVKAIKNHDMPLLQSILEDVFKSKESKCKNNLLLIAAAYGSPEICRFLESKGFPSNTQQIDPHVAQLLFIDSKSSEHSPLSIAVYFKQLDNTRALVSSASESDIEELQYQEPDFEAVLLEEIRKRLESKYTGRSLGVVVGFQNGKSTIVVYTDSCDIGVLEKTERRFCGRTYVFINPRIIEQVQSIANVAGSDLSVEQIEKAKQIINTNAQFLWSHHSNLNIITIHVVPENERKDCKHNFYIALYCTTKGFIPLGQKNFPKYLSTNDKCHKLPVTIKEGFFEICPSYVTSASTSFHQDLKMGCSISGKNVNAAGEILTGTIGPFIDINVNGGEPGFLTCAHVMFDVSTTRRIRHDKDTSPTVQVFQPEKGIFSQNFQAFDSAKHPCGEVYKAVFDPTLDVSVDAAAVRITAERKPKGGRFAVTSQENYKRIGFQELPVYNNGRYLDPVNMKSQRVVVKCGKTTHLTKGIVNFWGTQVRNVTYSGSVSNQQFEMKNQIEVLSVQPASFFQPGDSGSAVFQVMDDNSLECIGMAIGSTSNNTAIVTPISAILKALEPGISLHKFD